MKGYKDATKLLLVLRQTGVFFCCIIKAGEFWALKFVNDVNSEKGIEKMMDIVYTSPGSRMHRSHIW
jgi:hypothetical protein